MSLAHPILRAACALPVRGRHRLVRALGDGSVERLQIGAVSLPIDLANPFQRYAYFGLYEEGFVAHLRKVLRPGDVMIDPGANFGYISAVAAERGARVIALEPSRICFERLAGTLTAPNIELLHAALHSHSCRASFSDTPRVITAGFACLTEVEAPEDATTYEVECFSLDDLCAARGIGAVRYLKLDVEGAELLAIQGAAGRLGKQAIDFVLVETDFSLPVSAEIDATMRGHGYSPHTLSGRGSLRPLDSHEADLRTDVIWVSRNVR